MSNMITTLKSVLQAICKAMEAAHIYKKSRDLTITKQKLLEI